MNIETLYFILAILMIRLAIPSQINTIKNYLVLLDEALATYEKNFYNPPKKHQSIKR